MNSTNGSRRDWGKWWGYLNTAVSIVLILIGIYYILAEISLAELGQAFTQTNLFLILLSLAATMLTLLLKVWRWQFLLANKEKAYPYAALFWALMLGFYVNTILPFLRLGEIARIYALNLQTGAGKIRTLSTLVVEKILEIIFLGLTAVLMLPFIILPPEWRASNPGILFGLIGAVTLFCLYLVAFQSEWLQTQIQRLTRILPTRIGNLLERLVISGLSGLSSLRSPRFSAAIFLLSTIIAVTSVLSPLVLFAAFDFSLGIAAAAALHVISTLALVPPSTPAKIGVFDGVVVFLLIQFGITDEAAITAYTIVLHVILVLPAILFGSIAASRTNWRWRQSVTAPMVSTEEIRK